MSRGATGWPCRRGRLTGGHPGLSSRRRERRPRQGPARGTDGTIHNTGETTQGSGTWRPWQQPSSEAAATVPTTFTYTTSNGPTWAYTFRTADNQTRIYQVQPSFARTAASTAQDAPRFQARALPKPSDN
ncbi:hypothetical protein [Streptomyces sp. NPDC059970]|uniref:hypothetical protein n=1 Tax=Streptomyces sp. NPDC059970 TaxID=3347019 RepID=UPI003673787A